MFSLKSYILFVVVFDQLVLPMFRIGPVPFKISYLVILLLAVLSSPSTQLPRDVVNVRKRAILYFSALLLCSALGQLIYIAQFRLNSNDEYEILRSMVMYGLMLCAFLSSVRVRGFNSTQSLLVLAGGAAVHFAFVLIADRIPYWVSDLYRGGEESLDERIVGAWINPNAAMLLHNMMLIGVYLCYKWNKGRHFPIPVYMAAISVNGFICLQMGSRNQTVAFVVIAAFFIYELFIQQVKSKDSTKFAAWVVFMSGVFFSAWAVWGEELELDQTRLMQRLEIEDQDIEQALERPGIHFDEAVARISRNPIVGTGFVSSGRYPFRHPPASYHNDWLKVMVNSGILGFVVMVLIVVRLGLPSGLIMLLPFFLPGLTNTFLSNIPATIAYFVYAGNFFPQNRDNSLAPTSTEIP